MIMGGYILQPRSFDSSEASKLSPVTRELWFYILRNVNHSENGKFKRGQNFFQFSNIQEDLSWYVGYRKMVYSKPQITKALRRLREGSMVETMKATRGIVISVCNYSYYQDPGNYEGNNEGLTKVRRKTEGGNTKNKNGNNERMELPPKPPKKKKPKKQFVPPTKDQVINYFIENEYDGNKGAEAFEFYACADWVDSRGNKVKNWKQKMRGVWFKDENKMKKNGSAFSGMRSPEELEIERMKAFE